MDYKGERKRKPYKSNIILLAVLIVFCIAALIEIIHGQTQVRAEREKRELLEEQNVQMEQQMQELQADQDGIGDVAGTPDAADGMDAANEQDALEGSREEINGDSLSDNSLQAAGSQDGTGKDTQDTDMQIVFMGDSVLADESESGGVAAYVARECNAKVYNMAVGGTTAALLPEERYDYDHWSSTGFLGVANVAAGNISSDVFERYKAKEVMDQCDFSQTDYFVVEYGINDFLCRQVARSRYMENGEVLDFDEVHTYVGALKSGINTLLSEFPDAKVLLISPHYCNIFEGDKYIGNSYSLNYGAGTLVDFGNLCYHVLDQNKDRGVILLDGLQDIGIDAYTARDYLQDGIHLSEQGCQLYGECISRIIKSDFYRDE